MTSKPTRILSLALTLAFLAHAPGAQGADSAVGWIEKLEGHGYSFREPERQRLLLAAMAGVADPRSAVVSEAEKKLREERLKGLSYQPGIRFASTNETLQVLELLPATPGVHSGIQVRSLLLSVNGQSVASNRLAATLQRLRGTEPGKVALEWKSPEGVTRKTDVPLALMAEPPVQLQELLPGGFGYLRLNGVYRDSGDWISRLLVKWDREACPGLVLDLRDAGGNDLDSVARIASLTAAPGSTLFTLQNRTGAVERTVVAVAGEGIAMPVLVLVNAATHGAAEVLAATLQRAGRGAMLVGEPTAADPLVRDYLPVDKGTFLRLAVRVLAFPDGSRLDGGTPLRPDIAIEDRELPAPVTATNLDWEAYTGDRAKTPDPEALARTTRIGRDAVLQRGLDILLGLRALNIRGAARAPAAVP